jgi:hypothetical protein
MPYIPKEDDKPKAQQVTTQPVQVRKKSRGRKFMEAFIDEDAGNIKDYLLYDLLIPGLKDGLSKGIKSIVDILLFGKDARPSSGKSNTTYVSYSSISNRNANVNARASRRTVEYDDIVFPSRVEAEHVLETMLGIIEQYGQATIRDYYDCCGVTGRGYTDDYFGWVDLRGAYCQRRYDGYVIQLPRAIDLK